MTGSTIPKHIVLTAVLAIAVVCVMLAVFYGQYRWLAGNMLSTGTELYAAGQRSSFESRAMTRLGQAAEDIINHHEAANTEDLTEVLRGVLQSHEQMMSIRYVGINGGSAAANRLTANVPGANPDDYLALHFDAVKDGVVIGTLSSEFSTTLVLSNSAAFEQQLAAQETSLRRNSFVRIGLSAVLVIFFSGAIIWLIIGDQSKRIRELKSQALKLSDSDFGEPLSVQRNDEIGELAQVFNDIREKLQKTTISRDYVDKMLSGMNEAIVVTNADGIIIRVNDATNRMLGYTTDELIGEPIDNIIDVREGAPLHTDFTAGIPGEALFVSKSGERISVSYTGSVIDGDSRTDAARVYAAQNNTERRKAEKRIRYLARIDALTKIPNRMQFQHLLQRSIARSIRAGQSLGLFYIDIDHFKELNDTFGHLAGDTTLETVAQRLSACLPDKCVVGRLAGDEFAVIVDQLDPGEESMQFVEDLARTILDRLADPFYVQGHEVFMTASLGIACCPQDADNVIDLLRNADGALYHAKKSGGNEVANYKPEMNEAAVERLMTKSRLKRAFERDELLVHYQPKYNIETGEVIGAEALVRWELPDRGIVLPSDFIPLAEETNLIVEIGEWVLDRVCEDFRYWQRSVSSPGRVSVNLSLKQLRQANFVQRISGILRSYEVSPTSLELEITETTLMENPERTIKLLDELYSLGLHLAIDDFGTGYSSLSALQQFPISTLKVDQSFVRDIASNPDDETIVGTIIQMGNSLKMDVVAEGVETEEQLSILQKMDCTYVQGMLFGQPMSSDNYLELMLAQAEGTDKYRALFG
jgi:diguanylate cyclase (GGDEF)-like protein/PAS domain S-box-containing protein